MSDLSQGERYLVEQIRGGDAEAWSQLVERFQGRLLAFARSRGINRSDGEDLVQETFVQFLKGLVAYRGAASLETYLFMILRRRIVDHLRGKRVSACGGGLDEDDSDSSSGDPIARAPAPDLTASTYARRDERLHRERAALAESLGEMINRLKENQDFRDLQIMEMVFYAQMRNKDIGRMSGMDEKAIALLKHRWLKQLRERVGSKLKGVDVSAIEDPGAADSLLTEIWEEHRLSCPKRSTVGGYLLKTLDKPWHDYVDFHLNTLACRFCKANLEDLKEEKQEAPRQLRDRLMQSTVGFFRKA
jgi:RNA polymerase sigma factor (sigma-70 family)